MSNSLTTQKQINIASEHPSLSGHFPDNPVLPGVVILDHVRLCIEEWKHSSVEASNLKSVKFLSPVLLSDASSPSLDIVLEEKNTLNSSPTTKIEFHCLQNENLLVQGLWVLQVDQSQ
jgi:3-hydroxymyristoyl/3-hydroxydecanoyl-(acyl carrier protein) dehydratase